MQVDLMVQSIDGSCQSLDSALPLPTHCWQQYTEYQSGHFKSFQLYTTCEAQSIHQSKPHSTVCFHFHGSMPFHTASDILSQPIIFGLVTSCCCHCISWFQKGTSVWTSPPKLWMRCFSLSTEGLETGKQKKKTKKHNVEWKMPLHCTDDASQ